MTYPIPHCESVPPIAGPMRNAIPNAAPIIPIFLVLFAGVEISDIYASTTGNPAPPSPETNLAIRNTTKRKPRSADINPDDSDIQRMIYPSRLNDVVTDRRFFLPYWSESRPNTSPQRNIPTE